MALLIMAIAFIIVRSWLMNVPWPLVSKMVTVYLIVVNLINLMGIFASSLKPRQNFDGKFNFYA